MARSPPNDAADGQPSVARETPSEQPDEKNDTRSPLERFRTAPKKPLSVTDIVSPAWCELQYWYTLTKFGKKQRTPAMRQGSAVHRVLEEQVHTIVPITVQTKEDRWGLRLWNVIQGLRTLRATGMTRELEIWGVIDGQVVNGIIDEVSYTSPDRQLELEIEGKKAAKSGRKEMPQNQQTLEQFFSSQRSNPSTEIDPSIRPMNSKLYLTDVKTRSRHSLPTKAAMRPTMMQLMLYRSIFKSLAVNDVAADTIFSRYGIDQSSAFTDAFIGEISNLDNNFADSVGFVDGGNSSAPPNQTSAAHELQQHNNLRLLWQLMIQEFGKTVSSPDDISDLLTAQFIHAKEQVVLGSKCFAFNEEDLRRYLQEEMRWWKGKRPAKGVEIEEAYKCQICEFADECTWRKEKIEEAVGRHRERRGRATLKSEAGWGDQ